MVAAVLCAPLGRNIVLSMTLRQVIALDPSRIAAGNEYWMGWLTGLGPATTGITIARTDKQNANPATQGGWIAHFGASAI